MARWFEFVGPKPEKGFKEVFWSGQTFRFEPMPAFGDKWVCKVDNPVVEQRLSTYEHFAALREGEALLSDPEFIKAVLENWGRVLQIKAQEADYQARYPDIQVEPEVAVPVEVEDKPEEPVPVYAPAIEAEIDDYPRADLEKMHIGTLRKLARAAGYDVTPKMTKKEILDIALGEE